MYKYADFSGRASRSEYWWFYLFTVLCQVGAYVLGGLASGGDMEIGLIFSGLAYLALAIPVFAVGARRLHDTNRSGWCQLLIVPLTISMFSDPPWGVAVIGLILMVALIVLLVEKPTSAKTKYDTAD